MDVFKSALESFIGILPKKEFKWNENRLILLFIS